MARSMHRGFKWCVLQALMSGADDFNVRASSK